ncbi:MAG: hypothetical protein JKY48_02240 [Flavobacteriales bacterium]|nr:hypothetical protein [Flavobacteriales bacterium]
MLKAGYLSSFSTELKALTVFFLITLSIGFYLGLGFVNHTTENKAQGIIENYNGNEQDEAAETMKFKKSEHEMYNILHTHFLSLSLIFFILGLLTYGTSINSKLRKFLMIEPLISVILTFGGIYFIWTGLEWMTYVVMFSGMLMTLSYTVAAFLILNALFSSKP